MILSGSLRADYRRLTFSRLLELHSAKYRTKTYERAYSLRNEQFVLGNSSTNSCEHGIADGEVSIIGEFSLKGRRKSDFPNASLRHDPYRRFVMPFVSLADKISLRCQDGDLAEKELDLFQFPINGDIGLASVALPPLLPIAIASAAFSLIVGGKSVRDLVHDYKGRTQTPAELANRPVAVLFSLRERDKTLKAR